jgi:stalled ribosome rescue protein Dom34
MAHFHAVIWLDHSQARIFHFSRDDVERLVAHATHKNPHQHHKRGSIGSGHAPEDRKYFEQVATLIEGSSEILVTGPGDAKLELVKHLQAHHRDLGAKVVGTEALDHPSDGQVLAYARKYFAAKDNMLR